MFKLSGESLPFGTDVNRYARYAVNFLVFSALWFAAYSLKHSLFEALVTWGYFIAWMSLLLLFETFTLLPFYLYLRKFIKNREEIESKHNKIGVTRENTYMFEIEL